jgi:hypothetical protein
MYFDGELRHGGRDGTGMGPVVTIDRSLNSFHDEATKIVIDLMTSLFSS